MMPPGDPGGVQLLACAYICVDGYFLPLCIFRHEDTGANASLTISSQFVCARDHTLCNPPTQLQRRVVSRSPTVCDFQGEHERHTGGISTSDSHG
jgi:hypothetical protein